MAVVRSLIRALTGTALAVWGLNGCASPFVDLYGLVLRTPLAVEDP